jgi:hypothetical protein
VSDLLRRGHLALLLAATAAATLVATSTVDRSRPSTRRGRAAVGDAGQTTAEYGLVLLGAAGIALLLVAWATKSGAVGKLFDAVMDNVIGKVK